jgi:hypothetical protein
MIGFGKTLVVVSEMVKISGFGNLNGLEINLLGIYFLIFFLKKLPRCFDSR